MMTNSEEGSARPGWQTADCEPLWLSGPVATLQVTVGALGALAIILALIAGSATVVLTALGVIGLVPLTLGAVIRGYGWRGRDRQARREHDEDAAIVTPVAVLCWQPIVLITELREQIFHGGGVAVAAGAAALALSVYCARP